MEQLARNEAIIAEPRLVPFVPDVRWRNGLRVTGQAGSLRVTKSLLAGPSESMTVRYELENAAEQQLAGCLLIEWNLSPPQSPLGDDRIHLLRRPGEPDVDLAAGAGVQQAVGEALVLGSDSYGLRLRPDRPLDVWHFPVETVSSSEGGLERALQGVCVAVCLPLDLAPGAAERLALEWDVVPV